MSSNLVRRRYTPPTCTLEIISQGSPLFRWVGRSVFKHLNFSLNFDDPRLPEEKRITIHGDKPLLETLHQQVKVYIQDFLVQKPENFPELPSIFATEAQTPTTNEPETQNTIAQLEPGEKEITNISSQQDFASEPLETAQTDPHPAEEGSTQSLGVGEVSQNPTPQLLNPSEEDNSPNSINGHFSKANSGIYLKPRNLLSHDLFLGSLTTPQSVSVINLSLLQLFDLATALEEYKTEQEGLPNNRRTSNHKLPPYWAISAAMVAVTVGLTAGIARVLDQGKRTPEATPSVINPTTNTNQANTNAVQPQVSAVPSPLPAPTPGVVTSPGTSPQTLPTPGVVTSPGTTPQTLPTPPVLSGNQTSNPTTTPPLANSTPGTPTSQTTTNNSLATPPGGLPPGTYRIGSVPTGTPSVSPSSGTTSQGTINIPVNNGTAANTKKSPVNPTPITQVKPQTRNTQQTRNSSSPTSVQMFPREASPPLSPLLSNLSSTPLAATPLSSTSEQNSQSQVKPSPAVTSKENSQLVGLGHQLGNSTADNTLRRQQNSQTTQVVDKNDSEVTAKETSGASTVAAVATETTPKNNSVGNVNNSNSLFDQIPQVAEARQFFQQRWQPPSSLTQDQLEYTLALNADGTIKQITPRGQVAQIYLDRTQMPLIGEPFVSPVDGGRTPEILLILYKSGKVETRLQSLN
ncbi:DUF4335 domain-containing protein [Floridanema evergladense]|uniref:DUF4335 domain-containing protein n=1 Tax=Floridaenema evergladense BLCC-F167 TaxID=3153639 RepID=A0ABV4WKC6_9CYAN